MAAPENPKARVKSWRKNGSRERDTVCSPVKFQPFTFFFQSGHGIGDALPTLKSTDDRAV
jgi:hypothetical protein